MPSALLFSPVQLFRLIIRIGLMLLLTLLCVSTSGCTWLEPPGPLPWEEQLTRMLALAHRRVPDTALYSCRTELDQAWYTTLVPPPDQSIEVRCLFIRPDGTTETIQYDDLNPARTLQHTGFERYVPPPSAADMAAFRNVESTMIRIGPREAFAAAQPVGQEFLNAGNTLRFASVILFLSADIEREFGLPAAWSVGYSDLEGTSRRVWVSAIDGTVLAETDGALFPEKETE